MSHTISVAINSYVFHYCFNYDVRSRGIFIDCENPEELHALLVFTNFEHYELQGHNWRRFYDDNSFESMQNYKRLAHIVLNSEMADEIQINTAKTVLSILAGTYQFPPEPEKSPEEKARRKFENAKQRLRTKLVIERGHKCDNCSESGDGMLCLIRKDDSIHNYEMDNLVLRCRRCMNKMKSKSKG
jgi:hypothetical protein